MTLKSLSFTLLSLLLLLLQTSPSNQSLRSSLQKLIPSPPSYTLKNPLSALLHKFRLKEIQVRNKLVGYRSLADFEKDRSIFGQLGQNIGNYKSCRKDSTIEFQGAAQNYSQLENGLGQVESMIGAQDGKAIWVFKQTFMYKQRDIMNWSFMRPLMDFCAWKFLDKDIILKKAALIKMTGKEGQKKIEFDEVYTESDKDSEKDQESKEEMLEKWLQNLKDENQQEDHNKASQKVSKLM